MRIVKRESGKTVSSVRFDNDTVLVIEKDALSYESSGAELVQIARNHCCLRVFLRACCPHVARGGTRCRSVN